MKKIDTFQTFARGVKGLVAVMLLMLMAAGGAFAQTTYNHEITSKTWSEYGVQTLSGVEWTATAVNGAYWGYDANKGQQFGKKADGCTSLTLTTTGISGTISSITVNTSGGSEIVAEFKVKVGDTYFTNGESDYVDITTTATNYTFVGSAAGQISLEWTATTTKAIYVKSIEVIYTTSPAAVAAPTFNPEGGNYFAAQNVTISTETANAAIYYTIDGSDPRTNGLVYGDDQLLPIDQTTTVKAVAILGTDTSIVTTATYTLNIPVEVATIAAFKAAEGGDNNTIYKITNDVTVVGQYSNKYHTFIQDATGGLYIYGTVANEYNPGDVISGGVYGKQKMYNGLMEMTPAGPDMAVGTPGAPVQPVVATLADVIANYATYEGRLVTIENLVASADRTFGTSGASKELVANVGEDAISLYNTWGGITNVQVSEGQVMTVTGYIIRYNDKIEILPRSAADIKSAATLPYYVDFDQNVDEQLTINNGENTNKWFIGQAQGFDNNKLYISSSNGLTNKYDVTKTSTVTVTRDIIIPAAGATVNFDYRVNGEAGYDYLQVAMGDAAIILPATEGWESYSMNIPATMAGQQTLTITWSNDASSGEQFPAAIDNISLVASSCSQPTALQDTVEGTTATISWTGDAEAYLLQYKLADHSEWYSVNTIENTVVLNNLQGNSNYNVRVQSVCGDDASAWVEGNFVVKCQNLEEITSTEDVVIGNGTSTQRYLFNGYDGFGYSANLYTMTKAGTIHSIAFYQSSPVSSTGASLDLWVKAVPADYALASSNTFNSMLEGAQQICSGISDFSTSGWKVFNIEGGFTLEEGQNLLVLSKAKGCTTSGGCTKYVRYTSSSNKVWYKEADNNDPGQNVSGTISANLPNITINIDVETVVCNDVIECPNLTSFTYSNVTSNSVDLAWEADENETAFVIEYTAEGGEAQTVNVNDVTTYTLAGLDPLTNYTVRIWAVCGENNNSDVESVTVTTLPTCASVTNIETSNMSNTTTLTWEAGSTETEWNVQFKKVNEGDDAWVSLPMVQLVPTTTFGGLVGNTYYVVRIQPICDAIAEWTYAYFTSGCAAATVPYSIAFGTDDASCWENNGFNASYVSTHQGDEMISQALIIPTEGDYYVAFNVNGNYEIYASDRGTRADRFTLLESGSKNGVAAVLIPDNYKGKTVYFKLANGANQNLTLRKMEITTCPFVPSALTTSNITSNSIDLAWTADERATDFQVKVVDVATDAETIVDVTGNSTTIDNLVYGNTYKFYVRANCGNSESEWFGPVSKKIEISYIMGEQATATTCAGTLYDNGGANGDYSNSSNDVMVINPASDNSLIRLQGDYNTESGYDYIYVYDGVGTEGTELYKVSGVGTLDVTSALGALTIKFTSDGSSTKSGFAFAISCEPAPACANPIDLAFNGTTSTLSWNPGIWGTPTAYNVRYGIDGENTYQETTTTTNSIQLSGLLSNTSYVFGVQSVCGENETSEWTEINVVTPCMALDLPYSENFDSYEVTITSSTAPTGYPNQIMPDCWSFINMSTSTSTFPQMFLTAYSSYRVTGNCFFFKSSSSDPAYVILPQFTTPIENIMVSFAYRNEGTSASNGTLYLGYMSNPNDANSFVPVYTCDRVTTMTNVQQPFANAGVSGTNYYLAFRYTGGSSNNYYASIDNIVVEAIPTCGTPSISVSGTLATITPSTVAGTPQSYVLQIGTEEQTITSNTADLSTLFTNLEYNTDYQVRVKSICGENDESAWSQPATYRTPCAPLDLPYTENFDSYTSSTTVSSSTMPDCWSRMFTGTSTSYGAGIYPSASYAHSGSNSLRMYAYYPTTMSDMYGDVYAVLPELNAQLRNTMLSLYATKYNTTSTYYLSNFEVGVVTDMNDIERSFIPVEQVNPTSTTPQLFVIVFNNYTGPEGRIAFRTVNPNESSYRNVYAYIDDITVEAIPTCGTPSISVSGTLATITPSTVAGTPASYDLKIGNQIETVPATDTIVDLFTLFGLELNSEYEVSVRSNCGDADGVSEWSNPVSFITPACQGGHDVTIGTGTTGNSYLPAYSLYENSISEQIYTASELGAAGRITSMTFNSVGTTKTRDIDIYMVHTSTTTFANGTSWIHPTTADMVFTGEVTFTGGEMITISLDSPFEYNGTDNVCLIVNDHTGSWESGLSCAATTTSGYVALYQYQDGTAFDPMTINVSGSTTSARNTITFAFCPEIIVSCGKPSISVDNDGIATITPSAMGSATTFDLQIEGIDAQQTVTTTTVDLVQLFNLSPNTTYNVIVRAICSEDGPSEWSNAVAFTTPCAMAEVPYFEDFESAEVYSMPDCWTIMSATTNPYVDYDNYYSTFETQFLGMNNAALVATPKLNVAANRIKVEFDYTQESTTYSSCGPIMVGFTTDLTATADQVNWVATINNEVDQEVEHHVVDFSELTSTENGYVVFRSQSSNYLNAIDNVSITAIPALDIAITSVSQPKDACEINDPFTVTVQNTGAVDAISTFTIGYQVNTNTPVSEVVNLTTPLQPGDEYTHTFNDVVYYNGTISAYVQLEGDGVEDNNVMTTETITVLDPIAVPYVENFSNVEEGHGWNVTDLNNDGVTFVINNKISYAYNDEQAANDIVYSPCVEMAAGNYNVYFDYNTVSNLTEGFNVILKNNADNSTTLLGSYNIDNTTAETAQIPFTVAEDGVYEFGFIATSLAGNMGFEIDNFAVYPVIVVNVAANENGVVTPIGDVDVNYGEDLTLNIMPNTMYHVAGITVDDELVQGEDATNANFMLYTLSNVTESHNVYVDFKLEFHVIKSVENYNPAYTDVCGWFVPAATDTTNDADPRTLSIVAAPHYFLYSLEEGLMTTENMTDVTAQVVDLGMNGENHKYSFTTDSLRVANYYYKATFHRDTVNIHYIVETGKGYIDASDLLEQGANYDTWVDYSVAQDVNHTSVFVPYTTGDAHTDYHVVNVTLNDSILGAVENYTIEDITATQNVAVQFGYEITTSIRNYADTYLGSDVVRGTIEPATQLVAEGDATVVTGTIEEHFHLYNIFVDGVDMINDVVFGADGSYTLTLANTNANYNIKAVVKIDTFAINYNVLAGRGYADQSDLLIALATYSTIVNYGDDFLTNLVPAEGFRIENVVVDGVNMYTAPNYQYNFITESHNIDVTFTPNTYTVTVNAYGQGTVSDNLTFVYDPENPMNYDFFATPAEGYHIEAMYLNGEVMEDMPEFAREGFTAVIEDVHENMTFDVHFAINTYTVDVTANAGGTTNIQGTVSYNYGENVTVTATAEEGRYISSISIDGDVTNYTQADNMTVTSIDFPAIHENHEVIVVFDVQKFSIVGSIDATANQGTINYASSFAAVLDYGGHTTLNFQPNANYQVADVVVDGQSVGAVDSYEFVNVTANHEVVVSFGPVMYTLTATSNVDACSINPASTTVQAGSNVNYTLTVATGYHLLNVIANGEEVNVVANEFTIENVQEDYEIFANFAPNNVTVTVAQPAHATITPGTMTYAYGATPTYVIMPQAGYEVVSVTAGGAVVPVTYNNGVGTFTLAPVTADITLTATTAIKTFTITVINNAHGTIAPATQTVNYDTNVTFTITPEQFYAISDVKVDGASRGAISSYTFNNVTGNHTIEALFEAACYEPTNLTAMDITTTSAVLSWVGTAPSYEVRYRKAADANWNTQTVTVPTVTLTGLDSNTLYAWEVRAYCTAQLQSEWVANSFMTKAGAQPYDPTSIASAEFNTVKVYSHLNNVYVVNENGVAISSIAIFDINGKQVYTGSVNGSTEVISLNVANGSYIVRLASENGVGIYKVSIVR